MPKEFKEADIENALKDFSSAVVTQFKEFYFINARSGKFTLQLHETSKLRSDRHDR